MALMLSRRPDGSRRNYYFVFHANTKNSAATTLAPKIQIHTSRTPKVPNPLNHPR